MGWERVRFEPKLLPAALMVAVALLCCGGPPEIDAPTTDEPVRGTAGGARPTSRGDKPDAPDNTPGRWRRDRIDSTDPSLTPEQLEEIERLQSIGYVAGSREADSAGVTIHVREKVYEGLNLYVSGHAPEAILMDMSGEVLHRWKRAFTEIWPDARQRARQRSQWWRQAFLFPNGDLLAIFEGLGIIKLDWDSKLLWAQLNRAHHDLEVTSGGDIYVLTRKAHIVPWVDPERPILEDYVVLLDAAGVQKKKFSLLEAFKNSEFGEIWREAGAELNQRGDIFHTNTVRVLDARLENRHPAFKKGHLLVSMRIPDAIAVIDPDRERATWVGKGAFKKQHDPEILENLNLLVFDNSGVGERSRVLELDVPSLKTVWKYEGTTESPFYTELLGAVQRLPNGNTLITESEYGRAFEVNRDGEIVWEFRSPHRAGPDQEFVATLAELIRLPADFPTAWVARGDGL